MNGSNDSQHNDPLILSALLCHAHVPMALDCFGSWVRLCARPVQFVIYDDGSLSTEDQGLLQSILPIKRLVSKAERDDHVHGPLSKYSETIKLRETYVLIAKAFECVSLCEEDVYCQVDSDILFWGRFKNPFALVGKELDAIFMRDRENCYSTRSWEKLLLPEVQFTSRQNCGFLGIRKDLVDLDLLEWFLSKGFRRGSITSMLEQSYWALLAARVRTRIIDESQFCIMRDEPDGPELIGGHFTAKTRHLLPKYVERSKSADPAETPVQLRLVDPGRCTALDLFGYEMRRLGKKITRR